MTKNRPFDRAADFYDRTRLLPDEVATDGLDKLIEVIGPSARLLEAGIGTGRIGIPLWQRGVNLTGVDLSLPMMARLRSKYPPARLAQADAGRLPFAGHTFDAVLTVHVLHLISDWRGALDEFRRVLVPNGIYVNAFRRAAGESARNRLSEVWKAWVDENDSGRSTVFEGVVDEESIAGALQDLGAQVETVEAARYSESYRLDEILDLYLARNYSSTWELDDATLSASVAAVRDWAIAEYGNLDQPRSDEINFLLQVGRFGS